MSVRNCCPRFALPISTALLPLVAAALLGVASPSARAEEGSLLDQLYPDRTPGYVEEMQARYEGRPVRKAAARTTNAKQLHVSLHRRQSRGIPLTPTSPEAKLRADKFMEKRGPEVRVRLAGTGGGTVGFVIEY